jgi:hypothetical protein
MTKIHNPLVSFYSSEINFKEYNVVYILTTVNENNFDEEIYNYYVNKELYENVTKNFILISAPIKIIDNLSHISKMSILSNNTLEKFNKNNYILNEKNLVLLVLNISYDNIKLYLSKFNNSHTLIDIFKIITLNKYFESILNNNTLQLINNYILDLNESKYWLSAYNCNFSFSHKFSNRKFSYIAINNMENSNQYFMDSNLDFNKNLINNNYYINNNNTFTNIDITNLIVMLPEKEAYLLFCNLITSKEYCHLALNNYDLLNKMTTIFAKHNELFRYIIGYAWLCFYFEESNKKTFITKNDRFIFDINTASLLPIFPFSINDPKSNPYCTLLVHDISLCSNTNIGGICINNIKHIGGIATLDEFRNNLNIFCTGNISYNLFEDINWTENKIGLGGSIMCACIQKKHPLMNLFNNFPEEQRLKRYFNEYYANSDIDVMVLTTNQLEFINIANNIFRQLNINLCKFNNITVTNIKLICSKCLYLFIDIFNIREITTKYTNLTFDFIKNNLDNQDVIDKCVELFKNNIELYINNFTKGNIDNISSDYFDFSNISYKIRLKKNDKCDNIKINIKYKITSPYLHYPLELFMVNNSDFFATVQTFHLPCVRSYYNGENVYLTPSCISSHLTYMNLDYKYFTGNSNSIDIINKYRMRGFGTWLNNSEKTVFIKYSEQTPFWNKLYNFKFTNTKELFSQSNVNIKSNLGSLNYSHNLFHPRIYNQEYFLNSLPVDLEIMQYTLFNDNPIAIDNNNNNNNNNDFLKNLKCINKKGSINTLQLWAIEASWEIKKLF